MSRDPLGETAERLVQRLAQRHPNLLGRAVAVIDHCWCAASIVCCQICAVPCTNFSLDWMTSWAIRWIEARCGSRELPTVSKRPTSSSLIARVDDRQQLRLDPIHEELEEHQQDRQRQRQSRGVEGHVQDRPTSLPWRVWMAVANILGSRSPSACVIPTTVPRNPSIGVAQMMIRTRA